MSQKVFSLFYIYNCYSLFKLAQANEPRITVLSISSFVGSRFKGQKSVRTFRLCYKNPVTVLYDWLPVATFLNFSRVVLYLFQTCILICSLVLWILLFQALGALFNDLSFVYWANSKLCLESYMLSLSFLVK